MYQAQLPQEPVDRFKLQWWVIGREGVYPCEAIYYVNASWAEVCPDDVDRRGAPFVNQWQVIRDGCFTGRNDDWCGRWLRDPWPNCFDSEESAKEGARQKCIERIAQLEEEIADVRARWVSFGGVP